MFVKLQPIHVASQKTVGPMKVGPVKQLNVMGTVPETQMQTETQQTRPNKNQ